MGDHGIQWEIETILELFFADNLSALAENASKINDFFLRF